MAKVSQDKLTEGANGKTDFYNEKLVTGRYFMERTLPESAAHLARISTGADTMMELDAAAF